ncbi:OmpA family protein [Agriterribacter sp.]|uniref:OmpA family protein n=1 Tax=Agriterribacter sp. TaxID=2821509 RepID=UPI002BE03D68|nr:OmpA family protein [Agriterribacter sp.]HTN07217.1 OmpA family protein [Agriterribacter sp.]
MKHLLLACTTLFFFAGLASCVSKKKFTEATNAISALKQDSLRFENNLAILRKSLRESGQQYEDLKKQLNDITSAKSLKEQELDKARQLLSNTEQQLSSTQEQLSTKALTIEEQQKRLEALQKLIDQQRSVVENLRNTINKALGQYKAEDLDVFVKDGKVYVSLQEKLLFKSGSAVVGKDGQEALGKIAQVLNTDPKIQIVVEGHTDSIPIRRTFEDNWALSTARAVSIVRILTKDYQVDPARVVASGHSYFDPRDSNATPEGRALNRRTEIILSPNLDELYRLME